MIDNRLMSAFQQGVTLSGTALGNSCTDGMVFQEGAPPFSSSAMPPYNGTFAPLGNVFTPNGTFNDYKGLAANGTWTLAFYQVPMSAAPVTVQCWRLDLTLSN